MLSLILSRRDFRENDQIISMYTLEKGKMEVLARGVKKITSKNSAHLEPFSLVEVEVIAGKELFYLGAVQSVNYFVGIRRDLNKSLSAGFLMSALNKILHEGERDEKIFNLILGWLEFGDSSQFTVHSSQILLDSFFVKLLSMLGLDILESDKIPMSIKDQLMIYSKKDWREIVVSCQLSVVSCHQFIYKFLLYNTDRKINDWGKIKLG